MKIGEVCLMTSDAVRLANFYKELFNIDNNSSDDIHQFIFTEETSFTIYNDGTQRKANGHNICLAFTVDDVDAEYERLKALSVKIVEPPKTRPWCKKHELSGSRRQSYYFQKFSVIL